MDAADPDGPDDTFGTADDGLRLLVGSPAIDAGDDAAVPAALTTDLAGAPRIQGDAVDLGAYEGFVDPALTLHVDANVAGGAGDGSSWADAFANLQDALDVATGNDQIWIAEGTYTPTFLLDTIDPRIADVDPRSATFYVTGEQDGLKIYGGFAPSQGVVAFADRNPTLHRATLSGDLDGDDAPFAPYADSDGDPGTPTQTDHLRGANAYHVLVFDGGSYIGRSVQANITSATVLDGVTITGGKTRRRSDAFIGFSQLKGGGFFCDGELTGNACSPQLTGVTFEGNAAEFGGAVYVVGASSLSIARGTFVGNAAEFGGAIYVDNYDTAVGATMTTSFVITGSTFTGNTAGLGGALYTLVYNRAGARRPVVSSSTFAGNTADRGGALFNFAEGRTSSPQITNSILWGNTASSGGDAIYNVGGATPTLAHTLVEGGAGGVFNDASRDTGDSAPSDDGVRLALEASPAVDAGDAAALPADAHDLDGDGDASEPGSTMPGAPACRASALDLGAFERRPRTPP